MKTKARKGGRKLAATRRDWTKIIEKLNRNPDRQLRFAMGTPGSAQVTRVRLLQDWNNIEAWTRGSTLYVQLKD